MLKIQQFVRTNTVLKEKKKRLEIKQKFKKQCKILVNIKKWK